MRDQLAMENDKLAKALKGMTLADWYRLLNSFVFFFLGETDANKLLRGSNYRRAPQCLIVLRTEPLADAYHSVLRLAAFNTGNTRFAAKTRGAESYRSLREFPDDAVPKELCIPGRVKDVEAYVEEVRIIPPSTT